MTTINNIKGIIYDDDECEAIMSMMVLDIANTLRNQFSCDGFGGEDDQFNYFPAKADMLSMIANARYADPYLEDMGFNEYCLRRLVLWHIEHELSYRDLDNELFAYPFMQACNNELFEEILNANVEYFQLTHAIKG